MMDLVEMLRAAASALEDELDVGSAPLEPVADYTVVQVGEMFDRQAQTVRDWINSGRLRAYRFRGREYRVTKAAVEEFQEEQRTGTSCAHQREVADLGAWRDIVSR